MLWQSSWVNNLNLSSEEANKMMGTLFGAIYAAAFDTAGKAPVAMIVEYLLQVTGISGRLPLQRYTKYGIIRALTPNVLAGDGLWNEFNRMMLAVQGMNLKELSIRAAPILIGAFGLRVFVPIARAVPLPAGWQPYLAIEIGSFAITLVIQALNGNMASPV